ncbi:MAG: MFS transporter [Candidatus Heimdallarchaeota archaeon]|nr:MFS transporter [Candidatus Heimdallarchaeota archaeon]
MINHPAISKKLKISNFTSLTVDLSIRFLIFSLLSTILTTLTSTFLIIHVIDLVGIRGLGIILSISFFVTAITDYPTGVLADWIGHKRVLSIASIFFGISSLILVFSNNFYQLTLAFVFLALANGQSSGALQSWFDNMYKEIGSTSDPNNQHYREFLGIVKKYTMFTGSIFFLIGGYLAYAIPNGRRMVFLGQAIGMFGAAILFYFFLESSNGKNQEIINDNKFDESTNQRKEFQRLLVEGLRFTISSRPIVYYMISSMLLIATSTVWYSLILFLLYFGYTGSDAGAGVYRWILWMTGSLITVKAGQLAKRLSEKTWLPRLNLLHNLFYIGVTALIVLYIPIFPSKFKIVGIILIYFNFVFGYYFMQAHEYLKAKLFLEVIPNELRNSIYSLLPTLGLLLATPLIFIMAVVMDLHGVPITLGILLIISLVSVGFEYMSLRHYNPKENVEIIYDTYQFGAKEPKKVIVPSQWQLSWKIKDIYEEVSTMTHLESSNNILKFEKERDDDEFLRCNMMLFLKDYAEAFERSAQDGVITDNEKINLVLLRNDLINKVEEITLRDNILTNSEEIVIDRIKRAVVDLQEIENQYLVSPELIHY